MFRFFFLPVGPAAVTTCRLCPSHGQSSPHFFDPDQAHLLAAGKAIELDVKSDGETSSRSAFNF